jgi:hypothetical protein
MAKSPTVIHKQTPVKKAASAKSPLPKPARTPKKPRASLLDKKNSKRRDPDAQFDPKEDVNPETHHVIGGQWKGFVCTRVSRDNSSVILHKNARGMPLKRRVEVEVASYDLQELDHFDAMKLTEELGGGEEDQDLVAHEEGMWLC